eukprot:TRINITY_DN18496_c0_g1_i2.p1 TRINITY_DN18496_c0_g1~~TRINITY_DN18496_c0_g1_i2.p1  ORF type:complete len:149 (+),score=41.99 TRINITY_DN18496_c0_g1_i2:575-1021(+)
MKEVDSTAQAAAHKKEVKAIEQTENEKIEALAAAAAQKNAERAQRALELKAQLQEQAAAAYEQQEAAREFNQDSAMAEHRAESPHGADGEGPSTRVSMDGSPPVSPTRSASSSAGGLGDIEINEVTVDPPQDSKRGSCGRNCAKCVIC